jgi:hypothetical protein
MKNLWCAEKSIFVEFDAIKSLHHSMKVVEKWTLDRLRTGAVQAALDLSDAACNALAWRWRWTRRSTVRLLEVTEALGYRLPRKSLSWQQAAEAETP